MVKRYYGGLITSRKIVANATIASGIYNKNIHIQAVKAAAWPDTTIKIPVYVTDPFFSYNSLLINADTTATPFNADASTNKFNISVLADAKATNFNPYTPGYYSAYFDGSGDYLELPSNAANFLHKCTAPWTIESWFYTGSTSAQTIFSTDADSVSVGINISLSNGSSQNIDVQIYRGSSGNFYRFYTGTVWNLNAWNHFAVTYNGSTFSIYVNGVSQSLTTSGTATFSGSNATYQPAIGVYKSGSGLGSYFTGWISNLRLIDGTATYASNFTPPTAPLTAVSGTSLLTCQSNRFIDNSINNFTITVNADTKVTVANPFSPVSSYSTYGSGYFDGTGDYLSTPNNIAFGFGTGDYTMEAWIYSSTAGGRLFEFSSNSDNIDIDTSTGTVNYYNGSSSATSAGGLVNRNTWSHIAVVRLSGTVRVYVNGVLAVTQASTPNSSSRILYIGGITNNFFAGYINDVRLVKGTAVYTTAFTPPSAPLTAIANTSLLTLQNNQPHNNSTFLDRSNFKSLVTRYGNATQGTFTPYGANWSNYFDGTGDYLSIPDNAAFTIGTSDFTFECWIYPTSITAGNNNILCQWVGGGLAFIFRYVAGGRPQFTSGGNSDVTGTTTAVVVNQWNHVAITRTGGTVRLFVNGVMDATTGTTGSIPDSSSQVTIGSYSDGTSEYVTGFISNLRLVIGSCLYTTSFTPSTTPLTAITNTVLLTCQSNRFIDNSTNNFTITKGGDTTVQRFSPFAPSATNNYYTPETYGGSIYLDGSGDYVSIANSDSHNCLTGDFTIEAWVYPLSVTGMIFGSDNGASSDYFYMTPTELAFAISATSSPNYPSWSYAFKTNQWYHIAFVRASNTLYAYVNGVRLTLAGGSASESRQFFISGVPVLIGRYGYASNPIYLNGYISDVRLVKGTAVYAGNFTPPVAPLLVNGSAASYTSTANVNTTFSVANTMALLNFTDAATKDLSMSGVMETLGDSKITTANSKFGGSAMYFDGTGDYLSFPSNPLYAIGATEDYTIECWVNFSTVQTCAFWQTTNNISSANGPFWFGYESGALKSSRHGSGTYAVSYTWSPTAGTWYHVAATRASGTVRLFVNGVVVTTNASTQSGIGFTQSGAAVGVLTTPAYLVGYLDDLRFTKGNARYTGNFTPATSTFPLR